MIKNKIDLINFVSLFVLYFIQAMPYGFQSRYLPLVMRKQGVSITSLGLFKLLLIPWVCKFLIAALIVDVHKTKRFWLQTSLFVLSLGSYFGIFLSNFTELAFLLLILNTASATQDICVDWFAMNALKKEDLGIGNTIQVGGFKLGTLFSGGFLVFLMDYITISQTFFIIGTVYMASLLLLKFSLFNSESKLSQQSERIDNESNKILSFRQRISLLSNSPFTYWICIFVLIYKLGEQSSLNLLPIYLHDRNVSSAKIGFWTGISGQSLSIIGSFLGGIILKKTSKK
ncbi:major facilitator superfamily domain-containing 3 [Brachionus plicatilis]|uniref:Major facilitator superfamily domain-containing 3 n=1 Tax=Brachionus plicatilis TaxID=10195 RepID=A0A3M7RQS7_BRAPC|nr:major facilitator superfamily domain-containing 3 [Brachionus plicatilis]